MSVKNFIFNDIQPTTQKEEDLLEKALEDLMQLLFDFEIALSVDDIKRCKLFFYEKEAVKDVMELLPEDLKLIFSLHIIEALTPEEISVILAKDVESIQAKLNEAFTTAINQIQTFQFVRKYYQTKDEY